MRPGPNSRRLRGRGGGARRGGPGRPQNFESSGPDVKVRGSAQQVVEKYLALAREAATAGNPVMAENYYQHAEHYFRIQNAHNAGNNSGQPAATPGGNGREQPAYDPDGPDDGANGADAVLGVAAHGAPQPDIEAPPAPVADAAGEDAPIQAAEVQPDRPPRRRRPRRSEPETVPEPADSAGC